MPSDGWNNGGIRRRVGWNVKRVVGLKGVDLPGEMSDFEKKSRLGQPGVLAFEDPVMTAALLGASLTLWRFAAFSPGSTVGSSLGSTVGSLASGCLRLVSFGD